MTLMAVEIFNVVIWTIIGVDTLMSKKLARLIMHLHGLF